MPHSPWKLPLLAVCLTLSASSVRADALVTQWSRRFGDAGDTQIAVSAATDASGNVIIVGYFNGTVNFGGAPLTSSVGSIDGFVAKFNSSGVHQWSFRYGDTGEDAAIGVATDPSSNVVLTGRFSGVVNFGGGNLMSAGLFDVFLVKLNSAGVHQWSKRFGDVSTQEGYGIDTDVSGNVVISGSFDGSVGFGGPALVVSAGQDIFVAKYNSAGTHQWSQGFGDANSQISTFLAIGPDGGPVVTGGFSGTVNFGGSNLTNPGDFNVFVAKFNAAGAHQWSQQFGDLDRQIGWALATDASNNVVVVGEVAGTANFGGADLPSAGDADMCVAKFNSVGVHQWSRVFASVGEQIMTGVGIDPSGNVIAAGYGLGTVNFGGTNLVSAGQTDAFAAILSSLGVYQWSQHFGDADFQSQSGLAVDGNGNVVLVGGHRGAVNFGGSELVSAGGYDVYMARFASRPLTPAITSVADIGNDQGRKVKIRFNRNGFDDRVSPTPVVRYDAFRRDDPPPVAGADPFARSGRDPMIDGWTQVGSVSGYGDNSYGIDVPTIGDSTIAQGLYLSTFFVRAATNDPTRYYDSAQFAGYSVDNLAPGIPGMFAYAAGALTWAPSSAEDFDYFSVYGGSTAAFGAATFIAYTTSPEQAVSGYTYYFVTATDFSGNEGKPAVINALTGIGGTPPSYVLSISAYPNPFNPQTTIRCTLPSKGRVTVAIYDLRGAHVATLLNEDRDAGAFTERWDGRDASGVAASSGVYFARITHASGTKSYKLVLLK